MDEQYIENNSLLSLIFKILLVHFECYYCIQWGSPTVSRGRLKGNTTHTPRVEGVEREDSAFGCVYLHN